MDVLSGGMLTGLIISLIPGAATVIVIRRALIDGWLIGLISGFGTAVGTALYGCLAAFGLSMISEFLIRHALFLKLFAGIYLVYLGIKNFIAEPINTTRDHEIVSKKSAFGSTIFLALTSPITIGLFPVWLTAFGVKAYTIGQSFILVGGIILGATIFWLAVILLCMLLRHTLQDKILSKINTFFGIILILLGSSSIALAFIVF